MDLLSLLFSVLLTILILIILIQRDFASPRFLFCASLTMCVFCTLLLENEGQFVLQQRTFHVYLLGTVTFLVVDILYESWMSLLKNTEKEKTCQNEIELPEITSFIKPHLVLDALIILAIVGIFSSIILIKNIGGGGSWSEMITRYRNLRTMDEVHGDFLISQLYKIIVSASYVLAYIIFYNKIYKKMPIHKEYKTILFFCLAVIFNAVFSGGRQGAIEFVVYCVLVYAILLNDNAGPRKIKRRFYAKMFLIFMVAAPVFYYSSQLIGRNFSSISKLTVLQYLSHYLGGGLYAFNLHIDSPCSTQHWGQSSLANIYSLLKSWGFVSDSVENFAYHSFERYGNTVTTFGRWYEDWGTAGVICMSALVAFVFAKIYYSKIKYSTASKPHHLAKILYPKMAMALVWAGYDDRVTALLSFSTAIILLLMSIWYWLFSERATSEEATDGLYKGYQCYASKYIK